MKNLRGILLLSVCMLLTNQSNAVYARNHRKMAGTSGVYKESPAGWEALAFDSFPVYTSTRIENGSMMKLSRLSSLSMMEN